METNVDGDLAELALEPPNALSGGGGGRDHKRVDGAFNARNEGRPHYHNTRV